MMLCCPFRTNLIDVIMAESSSNPLANRAEMLFYPVGALLLLAFAIDVVKTTVSVGFSSGEQWHRW